MQIKDFLHLYIGCDVQYGYEGNIRKGELVGHDVRYGWQVFDASRPLAPYHFVREELLKLILRKLSDMTERDASDIVSAIPGMVVSDCYSFIQDWIKGKSIMIQFETQVSLTNEMRRLGFDVDELIPAGLAIDKTSLKN